jgi:DNA-binding transcriptional ArsR family regulator
MARAATTTDVFNAIAEPRRRQLIDLLGRRGALTVTAIVVALGLPQPVVSKHLGVLRQVGITSVTRQGKERLYHLEASTLKPVHDWVKTFDQHWTHQLDRIKARAEQRARERSETAQPSDPKKGAS